ncbi:MAG: metalloregulator ArsR/SmtB family transcription factor [Candidatus Nanopelagicales bacterium]|nr:metalloregulator ArsR/SmtB family transcription factor [Candidatus Nanopelagicales bacterium]
MAQGPPSGARAPLTRVPLPLHDISVDAPPAQAPVLDRSTAEGMAQLLKAVADPARLQLISLLRSTDAHEACVCDLTDALGLSQPTVSHHLKVLTDAGLLQRERRGTWAWFSIVPARFAELQSLLS